MRVSSNKNKGTEKKKKSKIEVLDDNYDYAQMYKTMI